MSNIFIVYKVLFSFICSMKFFRYFLLDQLKIKSLIHFWFMPNCSCASDSVGAFGQFSIRSQQWLVANKIGEIRETMFFCRLVVIRTIWKIHRCGIVWLHGLSGISLLWFLPHNRRVAGSDLTGHCVSTSKLIALYILQSLTVWMS